MRITYLAALAVAALTVPAVAQLTVVLPNSAATTEGSTNNAFPWNRLAASPGIQIQMIYSSTHFTNQGINYPVLITQLRWRPNAGTTSWSGGTYSQAQIDMSTSPTGWATPSTTFASNHGPDFTNVYNGPVTMNAGTGTGVGPEPFGLVDVTLTTPFLYDPTLGDLNIDVQFPSTSWGGGTGVQLDVEGTIGQADACRVYASTTYGSPTGTITNDHAVVVEVTYTPASGLYPAFSANVTSGASPLMVNFTDQTFTSDPGGVLAWSWDLDGDGTPDSTAQNPTFNYTSCGSYNVSLTATDLVHGSRTLTRNNFIVTDEVTPSFTYTVMPGNIVQFTDTSTPAPTSWSWDLNGDGIPDSTVQNPVYPYTSPCTAVNVTLSVNRLCQGPFTTSQGVVLASSSLATQFTGGNGTTSTTYVGNMFDISVTNPEGINVCALANATYTSTGAFDLVMYVTQDTYLNKDANAVEWRLVGTGSGIANGGAFTAPSRNLVALNSPVYLPPGNYGVCVQWTIPGGGTAYVAYTNGPLGPFVNADLTIVPDPVNAPGISKYSLFGSGNFSPRVWNGEIFYTTCSASGEGGYGFMASGCLSSLGTVPTNTAAAPPRLGVGVTVQVDNMPAPEGMFFVIGFSNTVWPQFGNSPLPFDLTQFGAPGCFANVSTESAQYIAGANGSARVMASIVNNPSLLCTVFYTQALVFDATANALGAVTSDAAAAIIGN